MAAHMHGKVTGMVVEGAGEGVFFKADLFSYTSENSTTHEFCAEMLSEQEAKDLVAFWSTGGADMVRAAAKCRWPDMDGAEEVHDLWENHLRYTPEMWMHEVAEGNTRSGYWDWVYAQEDAEDQSDHGLPPFNHNLIR